MDEGVLGRLVSPDEVREAIFMVCGPVPMMNAVEGALLGLGVDRARIRSERFDLS